MIKEVLQDGCVACLNQIKRIDMDIFIVVITVFSLLMINGTYFIDWITQPNFVAPTMFDFKDWNNEGIIDINVNVSPKKLIKCSIKGIFQRVLP